MAETASWRIGVSGHRDDDGHYLVAVDHGPRAFTQMLPEQALELAGLMQTAAYGAIRSMEESRSVHFDEAKTASEEEKSACFERYLARTRP
jgi:hypothetical protein